MHEMYGKFTQMLGAEDKERCVELILGELSSGGMDIVTLYTEILTPAQNELACWQDDAICIWREHVRTSIIRTILECCYPHVIKEVPNHRIANGENVIIACPSEEYHELGPRMVSDFFTLLGFNVTFVGANTPQVEIMDAIRHIKPDIIGISVTNLYNMVAAKKIVDELIRIKKDNGLDFKIILGGNAFRMNPDAHEDMEVDAVLQTFGELKRYCKGIK